MKVDLDGWQVRGTSVGGLETCLELPQIKVAFDLGRCAGSTVGCHTVLFTHAHADHMGAVALHAARRALRRAEPPHYVVPRENAEDFAELLEVWRRLDRSELPCEVTAAGPGDEVRLRRDLVARVFRSPHRAPCQGYHLFSERRKLRAELAEAGPEEIRRRREAGEEVTRLERVSELAFCGDTRFDVVTREAHLREARRLMLECTFLDERVTVEQAREMGHVHLHEVAAGAELLRGVGALLLTHVSARYRAEEARGLVAERLPGWLAERTRVLVE